MAAREDCVFSYAGDGSAHDGNALYMGLASTLLQHRLSLRPGGLGTLPLIVMT